jgi:short-subunit dehydrogenase
MNLSGNLALVTGASSGIGRAIALELAARGCHLALAARRAERLEQTARECRRLGVRSLAVPTDVRLRDECFRFVEQAAGTLGPPDILVNNAGYAILDSFADASPQHAEDMMATNYFGALHCIQAALPFMLERGSGAIVNVSSITGLMGYAGMGAYGATKAALASATESLRNELIDHGIRVSMVCPGTTDTEFFVTASRDKVPAASRLIPEIPPERVARVVVRTIARGSYRSIVPWTAGVYIRFKEIMPVSAHSLFRLASDLLSRKTRRSA